MYSDDWRRQGCVTEKRKKLSGPVYYRHTYDKNGVLVGVTVDFECADDYHYELLAKDWLAFCDQYLEKGKNEYLAFKSFLERGDLKSIKEQFAFEDALTKHHIEFKKIAFY